jgi:serine/threonine protein phosphatase PrpC
VAELLEAGEITPEEALHHPRRNIITHALGARSDERVDTYRCAWNLGDMLLLCTDGLFNALDIREMTRVLKEADDLGSACELLVQMALYDGATDNISVVLVKNIDIGRVAP